MIKQDFKSGVLEPKIILATQGSQGLCALRELFGAGYKPSELVVVVSGAGENGPLIEFLKYIKMAFILVYGGEEFDKATSFLSDSTKTALLSISWKYKFSAETCLMFEGRSINLHPGLLPEYRGCFSTPWAIINGEKFSGFTFHAITKNFDEGDIYMKKKVRILSGDTAFSLNYRVMQQAIGAIPSVLDTYSLGGQKQIGKANYYPNMLPHSGYIDPKWPTEKQERFKRAMFFPPYDGAQLKLKS